MNIKKLKLYIILLIALIPTGILAQTKSQLMTAEVAAKYEIAFTTANIGSVNMPANNTGVKVGELYVTSNATSYEFTMNTSQTYVSGSSAVLILLGGSKTVASQTIPYRAYFELLTGTVEHTCSTFPLSLGAAQNVTAKASDFTHTFINGGITDVVYSLYIVASSADMLGVETGIYQSELTITIVAP